MGEFARALASGVRVATYSVLDESLRKRGSAGMRQLRATGWMHNRLRMICGSNDIHAPGAVSAEVLRAAGVRVGDNYPRPIVDHAEAQVQALAAFKAMRQWSVRRDVPENSAKSA